MVIKPRPPIWIKRSSPSCPKKDQCVKVSTRIRPVTQEALVAVNRAVRNGVTVPSLDERGSISSSVPAMIRRKKPTAISCMPDKCLKVLRNMVFVCPPEL